MTMGGHGGGWLGLGGLEGAALLSEAHCEGQELREGT